MAGHRDKSGLLVSSLVRCSIRLALFGCLQLFWLVGWLELS